MLNKFVLALGLLAGLFSVFLAPDRTVLAQGNQPPETHPPAQLLQNTPAEIKIVLAGVGLLVFLIVILRVRRIYWETAPLSKRQAQKRERDRPRIIVIMACSLAVLVAVFLALFVDPTAAIFFAVVSLLIIALVSSAFGRGGNRSGPGDAYTD